MGLINQRTGLTWERLTSGGGGTVTALGTATDALGETQVFAATAVGLFRSLDAGRTWALTSQTRVPPFIDTLAVSPSFATDSTIFIGTPLGLFRSTDAGASWAQVLSGGAIRAIALSPNYASDGVILIGTDTDGIFRTEDGGQTWTDASPGLLDLSVLALTLSPDFATDQTCFAATATGLYRSRNGGRAWREIGDLPDDVVVQSLAVSPDFGTDRLILAGTETDGLWRSDDAGKTWEAVPEVADSSVLAITFSPHYHRDGGIVVATDAGIAFSRDRGATWQWTARDLGPALSVTIAPSPAGDVIIAGVANVGIIRCSLAEGTWAPANDGLNAALIVGLTPSPTFARDRLLFAADLQRGALVSEDGGRTWSASGNEVDHQAVSRIVVATEPDDSWTVYAASEIGIFRSGDQGRTWQRVYGGNGTPRPTGAIAVANAAGSELPTAYFATEQGEILYLTNGHGEGVRSLGEPFGRRYVATLEASPTFARDASLWAVTNALYSTDGGEETTLWHSADGGTTWIPWYEGKGHVAMPIAVAPDFARSRLTIIGHGNRILRPLRSAITRTRDGLQPVWHSVELNDAVNSVTGIAFSPHFERDKTIFVGTDAGVFVSRDGGQRFAKLDSDHAPRSVVHITTALGPNEEPVVFATTLGGEIWALGGLTSD